MTVSSAEKALTILKMFSSNHHEWGNLELSEKLDIPKSTVNRLLSILESTGFVQKNPANKKYALGHSAADIARAVNHFTFSQLVSIGQPYVDRLRDLTGETAGFEVMYGKSVILAYEAKGPHPVSVSFNVGDRLPIHAAAGAKAMLAFSSQEIVDKLISGKLSRFTKNTISKPNAFKRQLKEIRKAGVAFDHGELNSDVCAIAAPVFNYERKPVAGIVFAAPSYRMNEQVESNVVSMLKDAAAEVSAKLFFPED